MHDMSCASSSFLCVDPHAPVVTAVKREYKGPIPVSAILPPVTQPSDPRLLVPASLRLLARIETAQAALAPADVHMYLRRALSYIDVYLERRPRDVDAQLQRAELLQRLGDVDASHEQYQQVVHRWLKFFPPPPPQSQSQTVPVSSLQAYFNAPERAKQKEAWMQLRTTCKQCQTNVSGADAVWGGWRLYCIVCLVHALTCVMWLCVCVVCQPSSSPSSLRVLCSHLAPLAPAK